MISRVVIPQGFENMEEATIGAWLKQEMDPVTTGDPLCELITEKVTFQLPAEAEGVVLRIVAAEKSIVPVGFIIALIGQPADAVPDVDAENAALAARTPELPSSGAPVAVQAAVPAPAAGSRIRATPAARRAARDQGVSLEDVAAALPGKVISENDVTSFAGSR